jgi:hypothetical protein
LGKTDIASLLFCDQMNIPVAIDAVPVQAEVLTNSSLDSVPCCSLSDFPSHRDPKTTVREFVRQDNGEKIWRSDFPTGPAKSDEFRAL